MDQDQLANIIRRFEAQLVDLGIHSQQVILFGSQAHGDNRQGRDIDLIVISDDFQDKNLRERLEVLGLAAARILEPIEAFGVTVEEWERGESLFLKEAAKDGRVYR